MTHAVGMRTPDEAVVSYYDSPRQGDRFRGGNDDILKKIGKFNKARLTEFAYLFGASRR